ncbi:MAG: SDR family oxidoreductase [Cocleimonas sp.]
MPTLLITGANRGLGLELCTQFLDLGWQVHASCRNPDSATRLSVLADKHPQLLTTHALDVSQSEQISDLKTQLGDMPIDILFNNAGVYAGESAEFGHSNTEVWLEAFNINVISPMKMMEAFVDNVANSKHKIIGSMSSKMGSISDNSRGGSYAYRSTKTALNMVMMNAAHDLKAKGIAAVILHPGWVRTDMGGPNGELSVEESATSLRNILTNASIEDTGKFFDIDGSIIPW